MLETVFGRPNVGIHSYRVLNIAVVDAALTVLAAVLAKRYTIFRRCSLLAILAALFLLAVVAHRVAGARTTVDRLLFP